MEFVDYEIFDEVCVFWRNYGLCIDDLCNDVVVVDVFGEDYGCI